MLSEDDTRAKLIDPKLRDESGWSEDLIARNYPISVGRIEVIGQTHRRLPPLKADYVLRIASGGEAMAVVEAKEESKSALEGMPQAKDYAKRLGVYFAYAANGQEIEEFDFITNRQSSLKSFPSLEELKQRYLDAKVSEGIPKEAEKVFAQPYYWTPTSLRPRYYQEAAVGNALDAITKGQKRVLLTLATGTGKTVIAFELVWRLVKSGYFRRVLFIADRNFLERQAYNTFEPFGDARAQIPEKHGEIPKHKDIYFSIYQALYAITPSGKRLYQEYPPDFFDLVIIDECHRSGFGTWHDILKHFTGAVHLGMTATPKRSDNIDTYAYFGEPVYMYSYGQGVQDGYLAPFVVHRVLTNIDKEGKLEIEEAAAQGAEIIYAEETEVKPVYTQKEFEHTITLPDRTHQIAEHLASLLRTFDPMAKTMVFCVDSDHAELMAKELQNLFADLGFDNFAVSIIARTGDDIREGEYERFRDSEKSTPVIATTVDLLTTGVDVPSARNIVIVKPISSKIVFKQIIGRGSRLDPVTDKHFFRIIDYIGATRLFDDWESLPGPPGGGEEGPTDFFLSGMVVDAETQEPIHLATVILQRGPNQQLYEKTGKDGRFAFKDLPHKKFKLSVSATGYKPRSLSIATKENPNEFVVIELSKKGKRPRKVLVRGLPVHIAEEERLFLEREGKTLKVEEYVEYAGKKIVRRAASLKDLREVWVNPQKRKQFLEDLARESIFPEILVELLNRPELDGFDVLSHVAFEQIPLTRDERAEAFRNMEQKFLEVFPQNAREVIHALLEKYRIGGIENIENPLVFDLPPFDKMGKIDGVIDRFGDLQKLKGAVDSVREKLYVTHA